jgi:hypothetical protein
VGVEPAWRKSTIDLPLAGQRADDAMDLLTLRRRPDETWRAGGRRYWSSDTEVVDWGDAHQLVTPVALAMLQ